MTQPREDATQQSLDPIVWVVPQEFDGERLDRALAMVVDEVSRGRVTQWIKAGHVQIKAKGGEHIKGARGKKGIKPSFKLRAGQEVHCIPPPPPMATLSPQNVPFEVIYQDADLAVIFKPAGVVVHPGAGQADQTLVNGLLKRFAQLSPVGHPFRPGIVHRIDRDTSGLLMIALTEYAHHHLSAQLMNRTVDRLYLAIAWRPPEEREGMIEGFYGRHPHHRIKFTGQRASGKRAKTWWTLLEDFGPCGLFQLKLETGRTHQIRVHLSEAGSPLLSDLLYGQRRRVQGDPHLRVLGWELGMKRQALHAATLGFDHPRTGERLSFTSPLPEDMQSCVNALMIARQARSLI